MQNESNFEYLVKYIYSCNTKFPAVMKSKLNLFL